MNATRKKPKLVPAAKPAHLKLVPPAKQAAIVDFQTDAIALEQRRPPITARLTL